jgi:uncharacterized membrane protein
MGGQQMTQLERRLIYDLADMVAQHCDEKDGIYDTGCISTNKQALITLVELGIMEEQYKEKKFAERWERWYYAKFVPNWEQKLAKGELPTTEAE